MSENKRALGSDLAKVDVHEIRPHEYDDAPEFTDEMFDRATPKIGGQVVRRGRPKLDAPKARIGLRLDQDVIDAFKASGPGWQSRMNDALRKAAKLPAKAD